MYRKIGLVITVIVGTMIFALTMQGVNETIDLSNRFGNWVLLTCDYMEFEVAKEIVYSTVAVRRLGHVIEYFLLGLAVPLGIRKKRTAILTCIFVSFADQVIKIYVPGRHFDWMDLGFDAIGYVIGLCGMWVLELIVFAKRKVSAKQILVK